MLRENVYRSSSGMGERIRSSLLSHEQTSHAKSPQNRSPLTSGLVMREQSVSGSLPLGGTTIPILPFSCVASAISSYTISASHGE